VEQQDADGAADTMLSADNIEEDEEPAPAAPSSSRVTTQQVFLHTVHGVLSKVQQLQKRCDYHAASWKLFSNESC